jgi:hypothetical protein
LSAISALGSDWFCYIRNSGTSTVTIDPNASELINGLSTATLTVGQSIMLICDGTNFYTVGGGSSSGSSFDYTPLNVSGSGILTLTGTQLNRIAYNLTGTLTGNREIVVPASIQQYWITNSTSGAYTLTVKTAAVAGIVVPSGEARILYCNGTNVVVGQTSTGIATPIPVADGGTGATTASGARVNLGATSIGVGVFTAANTADALTTLGGTTVGQNVFTAVDAAAAQTALGGTATGKALFTAANALNGRNTLGATTVGSNLFTAANQAAAWTALGVAQAGNIDGGVF